MPGMRPVLSPLTSGGGVSPAFDPCLQSGTPVYSSMPMPTAATEANRVNGHKRKAMPRTHSYSQAIARKSGPGGGMGRPARNLAANTGISVKLMTIDTKTAIDSAQLSEAKNWPYTPTMNANGKNTSTVVSVEPTTAPVISFDAAPTGSSTIGAVEVTPSIGFVSAALSRFFSR